MPKFFVKSDQIHNNNIVIHGEDVNHIIKVLRMNIDDKINLCNSQTGQNYLACIKNINKTEVECQIIEELKINSESNVSITLFQGLPKFDKMEFIIQKATEIGVKEIIPVDMKRTIVKLEGKEQKKIERWKKIAEVASKQSMRNKIPEISDIIKLDDALKRIVNFDLFLIAYENEENNTLKFELNRINNNNKQYNIGILIGPEGGIDITEINKFKEFNNVKIVTLGKRILRTETAGIVMASNIIYELED